MKRLQIEIPDTLWDSLKLHSERKGTSIDEIVCNALSDLLSGGSGRSGRDSAFQEIDEDDTVFQASTTTALVEGVYRGTITVGTLRRHGDLGIGTFEDLDGEMIIVDGACYKALSDGSVQPVGDEASTPYAVVARFGATKAVEFNCASFDELQVECDRLRDSENLFYAIKVTGLFDFVHLRVVCKQKEGTPLVEAAAGQAEFHFEKMRGTLVGFWSPQYAKTLDVPGYHLHFLSEDRQRGGHLLDCRGTKLTMEIDPEANLSIILPTNEAFLHADLSQTHHLPCVRLKANLKQEKKIDAWAVSKTARHYMGGRIVAPLIPARAASIASRGFMLLFSVSAASLENIVIAALRMNYCHSARSIM